MKQKPCRLGYQEAAGMLVDGKSHVLGMADEGITPVINDLSAEGKAAVEASPMAWKKLAETI